MCIHTYVCKQVYQICASGVSKVQLIGVKSFITQKTRACHKNIKELTNLSLKYVVIDNDSLINTNYIYA